MERNTTCWWFRRGSIVFTEFSTVYPAATAGTTKQEEEEKEEKEERSNRSNKMPSANYRLLVLVV